MTLNIEGTEVISEIQKTNYQLEMSLKDSIVSIKMGDEELARLSITGETVKTVGGASDTLNLSFTLEDYKGRRDAIVTQLSVPQFRAHLEQVEAEKAAQIEAEKAAQAESEPVVEAVEAEPEKE